MFSPRTSLRKVLCLRPVFEGAGEPGIFSVTESRGKLGIFLSPRAYMEETVRAVTSRTSLRSVLRQQAVFEGGGSSEFFQVPRIISRGRDHNFFKSRA